MKCVYSDEKDLSGANLSNADLTGAYLSGADLSNACLLSADLLGTDLRETNLTGTDLRETNFTGADLRGADLTGATLIDAYLNNANLSYADFSNANFTGANFTGANLTGVNLTGVNLTGVNLTDTVGIASKVEEMAEASRILSIIESGQGNLKMSAWHTCETSHCIAGWCQPNDRFPGQKASLKLPTLARYFVTANETALDALRQVAAGTLSIWNK